MKRVKRQQGFTLIEVMLAMTLLSVMMVLLFSALRISAQSWDAGEAKIAQVNETALVYRFFQRHLTTARPLWNNPGKQAFSFSSQPLSFSFQGASDSLRFVSSFPAGAARPGLQVFKIEPVRQQNGSLVIKVIMTPFLPPADGQDWAPEEEILLNDVQHFELAYFGADDASETGFWQDQWLERKKLPRLVKIKITRTNEVFWPEMVIAIKTAEAVVGTSPPSQETALE